MATPSAQKTPNCLLCIEADVSHCHRTFIADLLAGMSNGDLVIEPITTKPPASPKKK
ncbi:MAG: DUF488 family protein [Anaerolineaceae bacterium]